MRVAPKITMLTALFAAVGIAAACAAVYTAARAVMLDAQLRLAEEAYAPWRVELVKLAGDVLFAEQESWTDDVALRYYAEQLPGSAEFAVYADGAAVLNSTGIDALRFLADRGRPVPADGNLLYGFLQNGPDVYLVLGAGEEDAPLQVFLVRNVTGTWQELGNLGTLCVLAGSSAVCGCAVCILLVVRRVLRPLGEVRAAMSAVASGRYDRPVPEQAGSDEFAQLARDCEAMSRAIAAKVVQLEQAAEEQRLLLSAVAHEMRTPVTAVAGLARTVLSLPLTEERQAALLGMISDESLRLERLCTKLTALLSAGRQQVEPKPLSAADFASALGSSAETAAGSAALVLEVGPGACWLADADLLRSAVLNLIDNARKAEATEIRVILGKEGVSVSDNGCGIPEELHGEVTKPFVKADASRSTEGFGLGLSLVDRIATAHGGHLLLSSTPGLGTSVVLQLPAAQQPAEASSGNRAGPDA